MREEDLCWTVKRLNLKCYPFTSRTATFHHQRSVKVLSAVTVTLTLRFEKELRNTVSTAEIPLFLMFFVLFYILFVSIVLFYVLFVCKCVLYYCHRLSTQLQLNISYHINVVGKPRSAHTCIKIYMHIMPPTCFGQSCGHPQGDALQRMDTSKYCKSFWTSAQVQNNMF